MSCHEREHQDVKACDPESPEGREMNEMTHEGGFSSGSFIRSHGFLRKRRGDFKKKSAYVW